MIQNRTIFHHEFGRNVAKSNDEVKEEGTAKKKDGRKKSRKVRYLVENLFFFTSLSFSVRYATSG